MVAQPFTFNNLWCTNSAYQMFAQGESFCSLKKQKLLSKKTCPNLVDYKTSVTS